MTRHETLQRALLEVEREVPDVRGCALASRDGLPIASTMSGTDASRVAAMAATVLALGARVAESTELGTFEETVIQGGTGTFVTYGAGDAVLAVLVGPGANLGLVHLEARRAAGLLAGLMSAPSASPAPAPAPAPVPAPAQAPAHARATTSAPVASLAAPSPAASTRVEGNGNGSAPRS